MRPAWYEPAALWVHPGMGGFDGVGVWHELQHQMFYHLPPLPADWIVMDVGANIGVFSREVLRRQPVCRLIAIEPHPDNIPILRKNIPEYVEVIQAAVTYEPAPVFLGHDPSDHRKGLSHIAGSPGAAEIGAPTPTRFVTLEEVMAERGLPCIDILKLDCEGSEFSILENATCLERVGRICGEAHDWERFCELRRTKLRAWRFDSLEWSATPNQRLFILYNRHFVRDKFL